MKKLMILGAMVALMLVAAAPAFAQDGDVIITQGDRAEFNAGAQNIVGSVGDISATQTGHADAIAVDESVASATVTQTQDVGVTQSNFAFNDWDGDGFWDVFEWFWWWF